MTFLDSFNLIVNDDYRHRVQAAMFIKAFAVSLEPPSDNTINDAKRYNLVREVMLNQDNRRQFILDDFVSLSIGCPTIQQIIKDNPGEQDYNNLISDEVLQLAIEDITNIVAGINKNNPKL